MSSRPSTRARVARVSTAATVVLTIALAGPAITTADATPTPQPTATRVGCATPKPPPNVRFYQARVSLLGHHRWYRQIKAGVPVNGAWWAWHCNNRTGTVTIYDGRRQVGKVDATTPSLGRVSAHTNASEQSDKRLGHVTGSTLVILPPSANRPSAQLVWAINTADGSGSRTSYVDATSGALVKTVVTSKYEHAPKLSAGVARVFDPNPVVKLQDESLRDHNNAADAVPPGGYTTRPLPRLRGDGTTLVGLWATVMTEHLATSPTAHYLYNRANDKFEQVMAYYAIDSEQAYLHRLGFTDANAESQNVKPDAFAADNSYYDPATDMISLGRGGVDDAEDPEVTWHEYGHALQDDIVPNWGLNYQGSAMGEGFGDYMAVTMSQAHSGGTTTTPTACVMDWDATSYTSTVPHCLRRTDTNKVWPADRDPSRDPHADGEIWSHALWDINQAVGRDKATRIIIEATYWMNQHSNFADAAQTTIATATALYPGDPTVTDDVTQAFVDRGFISAPPA